MAECGETNDDTAAGSSGDGADEGPTIEKLKEKIASLEAEQQKQHKDFGSQRAKYKEIYHQKEEEMDSVVVENSKLKSELDEKKNELFALELERNNYLSEKSKCDDEIASLQKIVNDTMEENSNVRYELERTQELYKKLEFEYNELRRAVQEDKERSSDSMPIQKFTQVTKSFARKVMSELGADSSNNSSKATLDDDMRKAHEDAEVLRSLLEPLETEIASLKDKLRDADQRLREYEEKQSNPQEGEANAESDSTAPLKSSTEEPLIQLSPSSPMEPSVAQSVTEAKPSPQENKDLEAIFGSGSEPTDQPEEATKCDFCRQHEATLTKIQQQLSDVQKAFENSEKAVQRARDDLNRERSSRHELETKWNAIKEQYDEQVATLEEMLAKCEHNLLSVKQRYELFKSRTDEQLIRLNDQHEAVKNEIEKIQAENYALLGKHSSKAAELQALTIDLPNDVDELQVLLLRRGEELITAKIAAETYEQEVYLLRAQLSEFQRQIEDMKQREKKRRMDWEQLKEKADEYSQAVRKQEEARRKLCSEKDVLERQLRAEIDKRKKLEGDIQGYQCQVATLQKDLSNSEHVQKDFVCLSQSLQKQLELLRTEGTEVRWQHDEDVDQCPTCKMGFNHTSRKKQHCRHCGHIFCNSCLGFIVNSGPQGRPSRVCEVCHTLLMPETAPYFSTEPPSAPD